MNVLENTKQCKETICMSTWATVHWMGCHRDRQSAEGSPGPLNFLLSPEAHVRLSDKASAQMCG